MTEDSNMITVGVVGIGSLGRRLAEQFVELDGSELVALADVNEAALADVGEEFDVPETGQYTDYERMIGDKGLDAVGIATPNGLHHDQTLAALDADLHVLCEKPLATNVEDAYEVAQCAEESDNVVMVGYQRHFNPAYDVTRERWALGDRDPRFITGEITHDWQSYYENMDDWRMDPELSGGGHLLNVGTHVIDAILWTTGLKPTEVNANIEFHDDEQIFDKQSTINIEFENGAMANVSDTSIVARTREHVHIWDEEGAVYLEGREWDDRTGYTIDDEGTEHDPYFGYSRRLSKGSAFLESIVEGTEPPATVYDGLKAVVVTMAAYESGRREERVDIDEEFPFLDGVFE